MPNRLGKGYGARRDTYDRRDWTLDAAPVFRIPTSQLPESVDLRQWGGLIKDQGQEGSCTGHAYASAREWLARKYERKQPTLSPQFLYSEELLLEGSFPQDNGAMPRTGCLVLRQYGCCEESSFPYNAGGMAPPTEAQLTEAGKWKIGAYHRISRPNDLYSCLGYTRGPYVATIGFTVYSSFETDEVAQTGIMLAPDISRELPVGGHEVLAIGYDIGAIPSLRPANCPPAVLIQNSWGTAWGASGYFWMPAEVLADPNSVQDIWMVHLGQPWKK
jgi:C1A family cysteine protease